MHSTFMWLKIVLLMATFAVSMKNNGVENAILLLNGSKDVSTLSSRKCVFCEGPCPSDSNKLKLDCDVCFKRIVASKFILKGCLTLKEVRKRDWEIGSCYSMFQFESTSTDARADYVQCLCNDRDECNLAQLGRGSLIVYPLLVIAISWPFLYLNMFM